MGGCRTPTFNMMWFHSPRSRARNSAEWECVDVLRAGPNPRWRCKSCHTDYTGAPRRIAQHILGVSVPGAHPARTSHLSYSPPSADDGIGCPEFHLFFFSLATSNVIELCHSENGGVRRVFTSQYFRCTVNVFFRALHASILHKLAVWIPASDSRHISPTHSQRMYWPPLFSASLT